jgi:hypothetical protein
VTGSGSFARLVIGSARLDPDRIVTGSAGSCSARVRPNKKEKEILLKSFLISKFFLQKRKPSP